jgi:DNA-directed RNA polymerase subunit RPC12/RpoP
MKCFRCGHEQRVLEMVMDPSRKGMICRPCAGLAPKPGMTAAPKGVREQFARPKNPKTSSGKFACLNCKYRFGSSKTLDQVACPYCGSKRISTPAENSADALLKQAGGREYDF